MNKKNIPKAHKLEIRQHSILKSKQLYKIVQTNKTNEQTNSKPKQKPTTNWTKPANNQTNQQQLNLSVTPKISSYQHYSKMSKLLAL